MKNNFNFKWSLAWVIIHSISLFVLGVLFNFINLQNNFVQLLFLGLGVTILARIVKIFTAKKQFVVDKWFVFWSMINSITIWIFSIILKALSISNYIFTLVFTALGLVGIAYLVRRFRITKAILWSSVVIVILILFLTQNSNQQSVIYSSNQKMDIKTSNILESIKSILPASISKECPQINVPLKEGIAPFIDIEEYDGWKVDSYFSTFNIHCYKGSREGQNPDYWYCGEGASVEFPIAFMQKTMINSDGSIGKTIRQSFYSIYDNNQQFVKTVCGEDPDKITEGEWDEFKDAARDFGD